jgi:hypothetical protein
MSVQATTTASWSPARLYLVVSGVFLLILGVIGFALTTAFPTGAGEVDGAGSGHILGIFETNGWHNLAALGSGAVSLAFALRPETARLGAFVKGGFYVAVTSSIALWGGETFWIASNTADQFLHGAMAVGGLTTGFMTPRRDHAQAAESPN